eukprot:TRINITY_DN17229_c0_g1_i1.p1 TRINITY_DN17229_c0_g1~~TRINITY_DN17229_c0_g1_i1.p1  ORF type:complete len:502 (+),score=110.65 TRINITY_DN17229_c0_g1_i1:172-1677(+)
MDEFEESSVNIEGIKTWAELKNEDSMKLSPSEQEFTEVTEPSPFPYNEKINGLLSLYDGDITTIQADIIVNPTNETLTKSSGVSERILSIAGPRMDVEMKRIRENGGCKTGRCVMTKGHNLLASRVIHTVPPMFKTQYRTAFESTIHSCYLRILSNVKETEMTTVAIPSLYPDRPHSFDEDLCHIAFRTMRRFLDRFGECMDRVLLVIPNTNVMLTYLRILPLYFPRSLEEELHVRSMIPEDVGDEFGNVIVEERQIRVGTFSSSSSPESSLFKKQLSVSGLVINDGHEEFENGSESDLREMLETVDETERTKIATRAKDRKMDADARFIEQMNLAKAEDFSEISKAVPVYESGFDVFDRRIVVIVASQFPSEADPDWEKWFLYFLHVMEDIAKEPYIIIYCHKQIESASRPQATLLRKFYKSLSSSFKKNLKALYITHPTKWLKTAFFFLRPSLSKKFWNKLNYVESLKEIYDQFDWDQLVLPESVYRYDQAANASQYLE